MKHHYFRSFRWLLYIGMSALLSGSAAFVGPVFAQTLEEDVDALKAELQRAFSQLALSYDARELDVRIAGDQYEISRGDTRMQVKYNPGTNTWTVSYNNQSASVSDRSASTLQDAVSGPRDGATELFLRAIEDMFASESEQQTGSSTSTLSETLNTAILPEVQPKSVEDEKPAAEQGTEEEEEEEEGGTLRIQTVSTDLEFERFKANGVSESAAGFVAAYDISREKLSVGTRVSYARAVSENFFSGAGYVKVPVRGGLAVGGVVNVSGSSASGVESKVSGGPFFALVHQTEVGTFSVGTLHQYIRVGGAASNVLMYGTTLGFYAGERGAVNVNLMRASNLDGPDFSIVGVAYTWFASANFALTVGYKTTLEISGYSSHKFTVGMNRTFL